MNDTLSSDMKKVPVPADEININRSFWVAIIYSVLGISSTGLVIYLAIRYPVWQIYAILAIAVLTVAVNILSAVLIRHGRAGTGVKLLYWSGLFSIPLIVLFVSGMAPMLLIGTLVVGFVNIYLLFPKAWRRYAILGPFLLAVIMALVELINPPFRYSQSIILSSGFFWPFVIILAAVLIFLALQQRVFLSKFLANISVAWKIILMFTVLLIGIFAITVTSYVSAGNLQYQLSNMYDFMLIPIQTLGSADGAVSESRYFVVDILRTDISVTQRTTEIERITEDSQLVDEIITRYETEWVTTVSQEFTQALQEAGKIELQQQELVELTALRSAFDEYQATLTPYLATVKAGRPDSTQADNAAQALERVSASLRNLIDINRQFADFSNTGAQAAYRQALLTGGIAVGATLILGVILSYLIVFSITSRLGDLTGGALALQAGNLNQTISISGRDEISLLGNAFNAMARQLNDLFLSLEQRVAARTRDLATVAEVGTATATFLDTEQLLQSVVDLTKERFNLYHSHIYLLDKAGENLVLASGAGEPGRQMRAQGLFIPLNRQQSLVARAARERKGVTVNDVTEAPEFLPNPLLPYTRSELAVPMIAAGNLIGVFDVQSDQVGRFTDSDIDIQTTLAAQIAVSVQNVRTFENERAKAELETLVNAISEKIQRSTSMEDTLQIAARELGQALGASRVKVSIGVASQDEDHNVVDGELKN